MFRLSWEVVAALIAVVLSAPPKVYPMASLPPAIYHWTSSRIPVSLLLAGLACTLNLPRPAWAGEREIGRIQTNKLDEISGIVVSRRNANLLWVHDDDDIERVYGVSRKGKTRAWFDCQVEIEDAEDIALGPGPEEGVDYIYLGDIGDNDLQRIEIRVVRYREPKVKKSHQGRIKVDQAEEFRLMYPDRPYDAETLLVDPLTGDLVIVTKERHQARIYTIEAEKLVDGRLAVLKYSGNLAMERVTGGDISADGSQVLLRQREMGWWWHRRGDEPLALTLVRPGRIVPVLGEGQDEQGEAIGFTPDGKGYITVSEGENQPIYEFALPSAAAAGR